MRDEMRKKFGWGSMLVRNFRSSQSSFGGQILPKFDTTKLALNLYFNNLITLVNKLKSYLKSCVILYLIT